MTLTQILIGVVDAGVITGLIGLLLAARGLTVDPKDVERIPGDW